MPDTPEPLDPANEASLFALFTSWLNGPDAVLRRRMPAPMGALETGLWAAYCAGYEQGAKDSEAARRLVECLKGLQGFKDGAQLAAPEMNEKGST